MCRRRHPTYYSWPTADWIEIDSVAIGHHPCALFRFDRIGVALHRPGTAKSSASARRVHSARSHGDTRSPWSCPAPGAKKTHSELFFLRCSARRFSSGPELWGHAPPPGAVLHREASAGAHGTHVGPEVVLRREAGAGAHGTHDAPGAALRGPGAALSREVGTGAALRGPGATLSREVGTRAAVTRGAPGAALRREAGATPGAAPSRSIVGCFW
jgi:hypothetical protein